MLENENHLVIKSFTEIFGADIFGADTDAGLHDTLQVPLPRAVGHPVEHQSLTRDGTMSET